MVAWCKSRVPRGLYTFRSATIGDGVLLPLLSYALVRAAGWQTSRPPLHRRVIVIATATGLAAGSASQVYRLIDPDPSTNWTFPAAHTFNFPGWYHAVFLVLACGFYSGAGAAVWLRARSDRRTTAELRLRSIGVLGVLAPLPAFSALLALDYSGSSDFRFVRVAGALLICGLLIAAVLVAAVGVSWFSYTCLAVIAALGPGAGLALLFSIKPNLAPVALLPVLAAAMAGAYGSAAIPLAAGAPKLTAAGCLALAAAAPVHLTSSLDRVTVLGLISGCVASFLAVIGLAAVFSALFFSGKVPGTDIVKLPATVLPAVVISLVGRFLAQEREIFSPLGSNIIVVVSGILFLQFATSGVRLHFTPVIEAEIRNAPASELSLLKWQAYLAISTAFTSALLANITLVMATTPAASWDGGDSASWTATLHVAVILAVVLGLATIISARPPASGSAGRYVIATLICAGCVAAMLAIQLHRGPTDAFQIGVSLVTGAVAGLFVTESVITHTGRLHNSRLDWRVISIGVSAGAAVASIASWMTGTALRSGTGTESVGTALAGLALGACGCVLLPLLVARVLPGSVPARQYTICTPKAGVLQDSFVVAVLAVSVGWIPNFFISHISDVGATWGAITSYFGLLSAAFVWVMKNNVTHYGRERTRLERQDPDQPLSADRQTALLELRRHILRQNLLAIIAVLPLALALLVNEITGFDEKGVRGQLLRIR